MVVPQLARRQGGEADALIDQLRIPRLADAEGLHGLHFHVGDHLGRRHHDGGDILVGIDAAGCQPVAHPQIMGATREGHGHLGIVAVLAHLGEDRLHLRRIQPDAHVLIIFGDRDGLAVGVQPRQDVHRQLAALGHLSGREQIRHRRQDMRAIDAATRATQFEIVARRAPRRLLGQLDVGEAVLGEHPLFLGDDQGRGIGEGDEAQGYGAGFRAAGCLAQAPPGRRRAPRSAAPHCLRLSEWTRRFSDEVGHVVGSCRGSVFVGGLQPDDGFVGKAAERHAGASHRRRISPAARALASTASSALTSHSLPIPACRLSVV